MSYTLTLFEFCETNSAYMASLDVLSKYLSSLKTSLGCVLAKRLRINQVIILGLYQVYKIIIVLILWLQDYYSTNIMITCVRL